MNKRFICNIGGAVLLSFALLLLIYGLYQSTSWDKKDEAAGSFSESVLKILAEESESQTESETISSVLETSGKPFEKTDKDKKEEIKETHTALAEETTGEVEIPDVSGIVIDNICYLGVLNIPELALELPVIKLDEWDPVMMDYAPCTYSGSLRTADLVIMAHNYQTHFRPILKMHSGQTVILTAGDYTFIYQVTAVDVMHRSEKEKLYEGEWDLTLFTCVPETYNRCAVRCKLISVSP